LSAALTKAGYGLDAVAMRMQLVVARRSLTEAGQ
jgi:hypothetical protein